MVLLIHLKAGLEKGATVVALPATDDGMATAVVLGVNLPPQNRRFILQQQPLEAYSSVVELETGPLGKLVFM